MVAYAKRERKAPRPIVRHDPAPPSRSSPNTKNMSDINNTTITGRLVSEAMMRTARTGTLMAEFRLASNSCYKRKNGEQAKETAFVTCKAFGAWAEPLAKRRKGDVMVANGRLRTEEGEKDGVTHSDLVLICESLFFISPSSVSRGNEPQMAGIAASGNGDPSGGNGSPDPRMPPF